MAFDALKPPPFLVDLADAPEKINQLTDDSWVGRGQFSGDFISLRLNRGAPCCPKCSRTYISLMCGRVIQSSGPLRYGIVQGMDLRDSRTHNYPPRWNGAPSQDLLVIRRNHQTGQVSLDPLRWGLIPY